MRLEDLLALVMQLQRQLAVIARKVSQCSKNDQGAYAFSAFKSVVQTLAKRGVHSMVERFNQVFRSENIQGIPP